MRIKAQCPFKLITHFVAPSHRLSDAQAADTVPQYKREPFASSKLMGAVLPKFPRIQAICKSVAAHPGVQKWLATRGVQKF